jgi:hypothetical protein
MNDIIEKRHEKRINISCELRLRTLDSDKFYEVDSIDLSNSGVSFCTEHEFQIGDQIEVEVLPDTPIWFSTKFMVNVVRTAPQEAGIFKIGAIIKYEDKKIV